MSGNEPERSTARPSVYLETSIISYATARPSRDLLLLGRQERTREWLRRRSSRYDLYVSRIVVDEAARGNAEAAAARAVLLKRFAAFQASPEAEALAERLLARGALPPNAEADPNGSSGAMHSLGWHPNP